MSQAGGRSHRCNALADMTSARDIVNHGAGLQTGRFTVAHQSLTNADGGTLASPFRLVRVVRGVEVHANPGQVDSSSVYFVQPHSNSRLDLDYEQWVEMGRPSTLTVSMMGPDATQTIATKVCAASREHSGGAGRHDAERFGPCSDHERIVTETLAALSWRQIAELEAEDDDA